MPDSPKCLNCLKKGLVAQTYKIAGRGFFKCHDCGHLYHVSSFTPIELNWRHDAEGYEKFLDSQGVKKS